MSRQVFCGTSVPRLWMVLWSSLIADEQTNGVIATPARQGHHTSYSVAIKHLTAPPAGRTVIAWLKHPGPPSCTAPSSAITCLSAAPAPGPQPDRHLHGPHLPAHPARRRRHRCPPPRPPQELLLHRDQAPACAANRPDSHSLAFLAARPRRSSRRAAASTTPASTNYLTGRLPVRKTRRI